MEPKEEMLVGEVLTQETASGKIVRRFSAGSLPKDPARRFAELFAARPRWRMADLQPFLKGIQVIPQLPLRAPSYFPATRPQAHSVSSSVANYAHSFFLSGSEGEAGDHSIICWLSLKPSTELVIGGLPGCLPAL